jgi:hypothetical protein
VGVSRHHASLSLKMTSRWTLDYAGGAYVPSRSVLVSLADFLVSHSPPKVDVRDPPGFVPALSVKVSRSLSDLLCALLTIPGPSQASLKNATALIKPANLDALRQQKAWELALAPAKNVPMQGMSAHFGVESCEILTISATLFSSLSPFSPTPPASPPRSLHDVHVRKRHPDLQRHERVVFAEAGGCGSNGRRERCVSILLAVSRSTESLLSTSSLLNSLRPLHRCFHSQGTGNNRTFRFLPPAESDLRPLPDRPPRPPRN